MYQKTILLATFQHSQTISDWCSTILFTRDQMNVNEQKYAFRFIEHCVCMVLFFKSWSLWNWAHMHVCHTVNGYRHALNHQFAYQCNACSTNHWSLKSTTNNNFSNNATTHTAVIMPDHYTPPWPVSLIHHFYLKVTEGGDITSSFNIIKTIKDLLCIYYYWNRHYKVLYNKSWMKLTLTQGNKIIPLINEW